MQENQSEFDKYTTQILNVSNKYLEELNKIQDEIKKEFPESYNKNIAYQLCETNKLKLHSNISYFIVGKERVENLYRILVKNIKNKKFKAIIYLIGCNHSRETIRNIMQLEENTFNTYLNRIGKDYLYKNEFIIKNFINNENKCNYFIKENGSFQDVYSFIQKLFNSIV